MAERQSLLKSIATKKGLQVLIDATKEQYRPVIWPNFFSWRDTDSITYETIIGESGPGAAASVVSFNSAAPLRTRRHVKTLAGEIPSLRQKFQMDEKKMQEYLRLSARADGGQKTLLQLIYDDVKMSAEAPHRRLDFMTLQALSTGQIVLDTTNNPDGIVTESAIDFGMPDKNKVKATAKWSVPATSKPVTDILAIVEAADAVGVTFDRIMMRRAKFNQLRKSDEVKEYIGSWAVGKNTAKVNVSLEMVNEYLVGEDLPKIVIVTASIGIEKNGILTQINPWDADNVTFVPAGGMGEMLNAPIVEKAFPQEHVAYAEYNKVLLKKWGDTDPVAEYTGCELNAFPSWKNVDQCYILDTEELAA